MTSDDEELIRELWLEVRPNQLELVDELAADVARVRADPRDAEAWQRVRAATHRLAGTLGSFGQQPAGETAVALDRVLGVDEEPDDVRITRAVALVAALHEQMHHDPGPSPEG